LLWAEAEGYVPTHETIEAPQNDIPLVLRPQGALRGRVEDSDTARPLSDFRIRLARGSEEKSFRSNDGSFEWQGLPPGRWTVVAQAPGYQRTSLDVEIRSGDVTNGVVFLLRKGVELSGRVVDNDTNEPVPDVSVVYDETRVEKASAFSLLKSMMQTTDSDGNFRFTGVPPASVTIIARSPFYAQSQITVTAGEATSVEIRLSRGAVLSGHILGTDSRTPVAGARVSLFSETSGSASTITSDSTGFFLFNRLSSGRYRLMAEASFGQAPRQDIVLKENQRVDDMVLSLKSGATVHGNVRGTLPTEQKTVNLVAYGADGFSASTSTSLEGEYNVPGVPVGPTRLLISTSTLRSMSVSIEIPAGTQDLNFDINFPQNGRLHGSVMQGGKPIAFADLSAIPVDSRMVRATTRTDEEGTYEIVGLSDGNYVVRVSGTQTNIRISGDTILGIELSGTSK